MNAVATAPPRKISNASRPIAWFPVAVFALVWLEVVSRLRFEWSINPQYGYGWAVPVLAAYIFWRRWQDAPPPAIPRATVLWATLIVLPASSRSDPPHSGSESRLASAQLDDGNLRRPHFRRRSLSRRRRD